MHITGGVRRSANLKGVSSPASAGNSNEDQWVTNFTETFQQTSDKAKADKAAAEVRLKAAQAELTAAGGDASAKPAQAKVKAEQSIIAAKDGAIQGMSRRSAGRRSRRRST